MPYRQAHWLVLAIFPLAGLAFWPAYLSQFATAPAQFHLHGITASLWLLLLAAQSWTIHHGGRGLHRKLGIASLVLFPLFLAGGAGIFLGMAQRYVEGGPFYAMYAPRLAWIDLVSVAAFAWFFHQAMRHRRQTQIHARYLLATAFLLLPPILGRLGPILPPLGIAGPQDFWKLGISFQLGNAIPVLIAFALALRSGRYGRPWWEAGGAILLAAILYQTVGGTEWWQRLFAQFAAVPDVVFSLVAAGAGVAIAASGWFGGKKRVPAIA